MLASAFLAAASFVDSVLISDLASERLVLSSVAWAAKLSHLASLSSSFFASEDRIDSSALSSDINLLAAMNHVSRLYSG